MEARRLAWGRGRPIDEKRAHANRGRLRRAVVKRRAPVSPEELGSPVGHLALEDGTPVYDREGKRVGVVEHVDAPSGIFEGIVIHTYPLPGRHLYADVHQVAELRERGVLLSVGRDDVPHLKRGSGWLLAPQSVPFA